MLKHEIKIPAVQARSYEVEIGTGFLSELWQKIEADFAGHSKFIVTDENLVSAGLLNTLLDGREVPAFVIKPAGESSKNINTVVSIIETMEKVYLGRDSCLVALGGGTVGDIAGFAASIFKRGIPIIQIPTTTVAQADSAIGGKTGVDSSISKNAFGAFWHPAAVYIDVATLMTLDDRQFRAGLVESVKHALIADSRYFNFLEQNLDAILQREPAILEQVAYLNCIIKGNVVEADPNEKNQRRILNYGHTIGHAVEAASGFKLLHGEAVAIGIIGAGLIEIELQLSQKGRLERIQKILERLAVPVKLPKDLADATLRSACSAEAACLHVAFRQRQAAKAGSDSSILRSIAAAEDESILRSTTKDESLRSTSKNLIDIIKHDKKAIKKWPKFVLISDIGKVYCPQGQWAVDVSCELVEKVLQKL
ncbi:MAG: 3-dehydroquinate synthase [Sedimentisphaerales bacterium]|nr:3-dehydroquinate synthase [Sedimentisphaerales bacterium]